MANEPPLEEIEWRAPTAVQAMGGLNRNSILHYFAQSPFFDSTSNNAVLINQSQFNPALFQVLQTRETFESRLQTMQGLEFVVAEPLPPDSDPYIWVIRKQRRRKRAGAADEVTALANFYVVGENIYMAPTVGNIIASRLLSAVTSLQKLQSTISGLATYSPAHGHHYLSASQKQSAPSLQTSKESTPMPGSQVPGSQRSQGSQAQAKSDAAVTSTRLLLDSMTLYSRYSDQFTDLNPLIGEPGNFHLAHSSNLLQSQQIKSQPSSQQSKDKLQLEPQKRPEPTRKATKSEKNAGSPPKPKRRKSSKNAPTLKSAT